nr:TnsA-like heteromeric transposase endonuclease subunit [Gordonia polyisoprenivorans]
MTVPTGLKPTSEPLTGTATPRVSWRDLDGQFRSEIASPGLLHEHLETARAFRSGVQYQNRRNRHSRQFVIPQRSHVWCESALEADALLVLEFEGDTQQIASQPMKLVFADGTDHVPDFFALLRSGDQVVYDVKPSGRMTAEATDQFRKTAELCASVGWKHRVLNDPHPTTIQNLHFIRPARHDHYHPSPKEFRRIREVFASGVPFSDGTIMADLKHPNRAAAHVRHLLWHRHLDADLTVPVSPTSVLHTIRNEKPCNCGA